ncbi:MAG TPA: hypothetical protein PK778_09435 [Bacillota bacterium]|nr:hypothetical protein [Clostridiales bacterium]HPT86198.1 hypothetical protein [Bacillota bacterium]
MIEKIRLYLSKFGYWVVSLLAGRYGLDTFGKAIFIAAVALAAINIFASSPVLYIIQNALLLWEIFRFFSKNHAKRRAENAAFLRFWDKTKTFFKLRRSMLRDRKTHVYKRCPTCKAMLRLPKSKGRHSVRCPRCNSRFDIRI